MYLKNKVWGVKMDGINYKLKEIQNEIQRLGSNNRFILDCVYRMEDFLKAPKQKIDKEISAKDKKELEDYLKSLNDFKDYLEKKDDGKDAMGKFGKYFEAILENGYCVVEGCYTPAHNFYNLCMKHFHQPKMVVCTVSGAAESIKKDEPENTESKITDFSDWAKEIDEALNLLKKEILAPGHKAYCHYKGCDRAAYVSDIGYRYLFCLYHSDVVGYRIVDKA